MTNNEHKLLHLESASAIMLLVKIADADLYDEERKDFAALIAVLLKVGRATSQSRPPEDLSRN